MARTAPKAAPSANVLLRRRVLTACLLASGAAALTYEVVWLRQLSLVMGHTVYALAAVLDAFLGGLALGAYLGGRWSERRGVTLRLYAIIELGIGVSAVLMPWLIKALGPVFGAAYRSLQDSFVAYNLVQFLACGVLLLIPTVLMGATLPIITSLLLRDERDVSVGAGRLYAANSFGGALGAGIAGFALLPALGMLLTGVVAAVVNAAVAAAAFWLARRTGDATLLPPAPADEAAATPRPTTTTAAAAGWPAPSPALLVLLYGASGFAALALEVGWARIVSLSIGSTTYGFTIILLTYITGLAVGSWLLPRFEWIRTRPVRALFALHAVVALWGLVTLSYLGDLPLRVASLIGATGNLGGSTLLAWETILVGLTIAVPTLAMGGMFPLVTRLIRDSVASTGRAVGSTYAANTVGNILGSFVAGFILVPMVGMRTTIVVSCLLSAAVAMGYLLPALRTSSGPALTRAGILAGAVVLAAVIAPHWDREIVTSGPYLYGQSIMSTASKLSGPDRIAEAIRKRYDIVDYREGASTVVTVKNVPGSTALHLQVGGKSDAYSYASTQNFIADLALMLHGPAQDALIVGLGSGSTLDSALQNDVQHVDCVEISPEVRDMAVKHFSKFTHDSIANPRAHVVIADGRNHLRHAGKSYDVIISQPSNPWVSGAASLFTREYFEDVRDHLRPGGIGCSWFKFADDTGITMKTVLRTWSDVFPTCYLFDTRALGEYVLIGLRDDGKLSARNVADGLARPAVKADLERMSIVTPADLLGYFVLGPAGIKAYSAETPLNTDDRTRLEYEGPKLVPQGRKIAILAELESHREDPAAYLDASLATPEETAAFSERLAAIHRSKQVVMNARQLEQGGGRSPQWEELVRQARLLNPRDAYVASSGGTPAASD